MFNHLNIPLEGIEPKKVNAFKDLINRYLAEDDEHNNMAVHGGVIPAVETLAAGGSLLEVIRSIDSDLSGFQLHWVMTTLGEYAKGGDKIMNVWTAYQKKLEPKKKAPRKSKSSTQDS